MKTIKQSEIKRQINDCYDAYDPSWPLNIGNKDVMAGFKYHLEQTAGLKLDFELDINKRDCKMGYKINTIEIVDDEAFMVWMLTWS